MKAFNRSKQKISTSAKDNQKEKYNLEVFANDFLIYYNEREHLNAKMASFGGMKMLRIKNWFIKSERAQKIEDKMRRCLHK